MFERRRRCISKENLHVDKKSNGQGCAILAEGLHNLVSGWAFHWFGDDGAAPRSSPSPGIMLDRKCGSTTEKGMPPPLQMPALGWLENQDPFRAFFYQVQMLARIRAVLQGTIRHDPLKLEVRFDACKKHS